MNRTSLIIGLWTAILIGICIRIGISPHAHDVFGTYVDAGRKWEAAQPLYTYTRGFVYSPPIAAFFALFSWLPTSVGSVLWRLLNACVLIVALRWWMRARMYERIPETLNWLVYLLILPLTVGNLNNGQVNPMIIGLLMISILAARDERWTVSAVCMAVATYLKVYPLSVGLLLVLIYPRQFGCRLLLILAAMGALSFVLQRPDYVFEQYQRWFRTRAADDRRMNIDIAPRDFAMILRLLHINLQAQIVLILQAIAGAAIAAVCVIGRIQNWSIRRLSIWVLSAGTCWMLLFGPTTEDATYAMIAPALVFALIECFQQQTPVAMRVLIATSFALLLLGLILNAFFGLKKTPALMSIQPIGAVMFAGYAVVWLFNPQFWDKGRELCG
jgi:Glycosyltransferase family 87